MATMKIIALSIFLTVISIFIPERNIAQETDNKVSDFNRNGINAYIGLIEFNLNYERNIIRRPESLSNIRMGVGYGIFATASQGFYLNPAFVQLLGKNNSYLELDLGFKYIISSKGMDPAYAKPWVSDFFIGYRHEKKDGKRIFRIGFNWPALINVGLGQKL
jgi:hypothetical protein